MANWSRVDLSTPAGTSLCSGTLRAAVNLHGLIELFVSDYSGVIWHTAQRRVPSAPPDGHSGWTTEWPSEPLWTSFKVPGAVSATLRPAPLQFTVARNGDGRLEIIAIGFDGNPYHMYEVPVPAGVEDLSEVLSWSGWLAMTASPLTLFEEYGLNTWLWPYSPAAASLNGMIVVCYFSSTNQGSVYYDYQVADKNQVGGVGWASAANKALFTIPLPFPQDQLFASIALVPTGGTLSLMMLSTLGGIRASGFYAATLTTPGGGWSGWQPVPAPFGTSGYPQIFPQGASPQVVAASIGYLPGGGAALFFNDTSGALTVLRQVLTQAKAGAPLDQLYWNDSYDPQLPANSVGGFGFGVAVVEDQLAKKSDPSNLHQMAIFTSNDQMQLLGLNFQSPATVPAVPGPWPYTYGPTGAQAVLDDGTAGAFTRVTSLAAVTDQNGVIQVFGMTDSTPNVYQWSEPA